MQLYLPGLPWNDSWTTLEIQVSSPGPLGRVLGLSTCLFIHGNWVDRWSSRFAMPEATASEEPLFCASLQAIDDLLHRSKVWVGFNTPIDRLAYEVELVGQKFEEFTNDTLILDVATLHTFLAAQSELPAIPDILEHWGVETEANPVAGDVLIIGKILAKMMPKLPSDFEKMRDLQEEATEYAREHG